MGRPIGPSSDMDRFAYETSGIVVAKRSKRGTFSALIKHHEIVRRRGIGKRPELL